MCVSLLPAPPTPRKKQKRGDRDYQLSTYVRINGRLLYFDCHSRKLDKRYRFQHYSKGEVVFDETGTELLSSRIELSEEDLVHFRRIIIGWKYLESLGKGY